MCFLRNPQFDRNFPFFSFYLFKLFKASFFFLRKFIVIKVNCRDYRTISWTLEQRNKIKTNRDISRMSLSFTLSHSYFLFLAITFFFFFFSFPLSPRDLSRSCPTFSVVPRKKELSIDISAIILSSLFQSKQSTK